eukprot:8026456-Ditylum_brightwellii.AAC.1
MAGMGTDSKKLEFISNSTVYEDNSGAIEIATCPRLTSTKSGEVKIVEVESSKQLADIFTKRLQGGKFLAIWK